MPKAKTVKRSLYSDMMSDAQVSSKTPKVVLKKPDQTMDLKTSKKILKLIHEQQVEESANEPNPEIREEDSNSEWDEFEEEDLNIQDLDDTLIQPFMTPKEPIVLPSLSGMNEKVVEVYTKVGDLLSRYKSGPVPKTFKILPTLRDWEEVLMLTRPENWTPNAMYQATRLFSSNLKEKMAQRFYSVFLLERLRNDIGESKKLNVHLYMALKKALFKPGAFFKGILLPLCESGSCTLHEASIIGSVLVKVSIPMLHSAAALLKIAEMNYSGPNSLFIRILLDKKYALPFKVIDALVFHFLRFKDDERLMPILWHQALLTFCQRYKNDLTEDQKDAILDLVKVKFHDFLSPDIRRELAHSTCRGEAPEVEMNIE